RTRISRPPRSAPTYRSGTQYGNRKRAEERLHWNLVWCSGQRNLVLRNRRARALRREGIVDRREAAQRQRGLPIGGGPMTAAVGERRKQAADRDDHRVLAGGARKRHHVIAMRAGHVDRVIGAVAEQ